MILFKRKLKSNIKSRDANFIFSIKRTSLWLLIFTFFCADIAAKPVQITESYPFLMSFRAFDSLKFGSKAFQEQLDNQAPYAWIHGSTSEQKFKAIRKRWPDKIVTLQNAYGGISEEDFSTVWPGHLLYKTGTLLARDISPNDNLIVVEDQHLIAKNNKIIKKINRKFPLALILYALDKAGRPDWEHAEHVVLESMGKRGLTIRRGQWGSKPLAFKAGKAVVAAHMMFWTKQWQLNFSLHAPRGGVGNLTAAEWFARKIAQKVIASKADGIEFDVARWTWGYPEANPMDIDNNLVADYGYIDGINSFGLGGRVFFRELRKQLGPDKIIQADSNDALTGVRGWSYLNGVQLESFPIANDFDLFSQAFLHLRLWVDNAEVLPKVSYPFTKTPTTVFANAHLPNGKPTNFRFRVGFAAATLMGMPHPFANLDRDDFDPANAKLGNIKVHPAYGIFYWDEYHGGDLNDWHWLGRAVGVAQQELNDVDKTDLLAKTTWQWKMDGGFEAKHSRDGGGFSVDVQHIPDGILPRKMWAGVRLAPKDGNAPLLQPGREYTLEFKARGADVWHYAGQSFDHVPRMITISGAVTSKSKKPLSVLIDNQFRTYRISFIANASHSPTPVFGVSEQIGGTEIRDIKLYAGGAERWWRQFENGLVLLNMTNDPWRFTLPKGSYKRLKGRQVPDVNTGQAVGTEVVVPSRDALFLVKAHVK
ncbi:MAG: hypothetical protein ACU837_02890 [Gammaproteobacteria bacterium]